MTADMGKGRENVALTIECGQCGASEFRVSWIAVPIAAEGVMADRAFRPLRPRDEKEGVDRLSPRYGFECLACGVFLLASPDGPDLDLARYTN